MSDPLVVQLARLAPVVDLAASRDLFERHRGEIVGDHGRPRGRRIWLAAACVLLLVAGVAGVVSVAGRDDGTPGAPPAVNTTQPPATTSPATTSPATTSPGVPGGGTELRLIAREPVGDPDRRGIFAAGTRDDLDRLLASYPDGFDRFAAEVDLDSEVAVVIERLDNACPPDVERFAPVERTWRVEWSAPTDQACEDIGLGWVYLLAVRRDALEGIESFILPAEQQGSIEWEELTVAVPGAAAQPTLPSPVTTNAASAPPSALHTGIAGPGSGGRNIEVALSDDELEAMWARWVDPPATLPDVDLDRVVVVAFEVGGGPCPERFDHFEQSGPVWTPEVVTGREGRDDCEAEIAFRWVNVVQVERSTLGRSATIEHPAGRSAVYLDELDAPPGSRIDVPLVGEAQAPLGTIVVARDSASYDAMWVQIGADGVQPGIDFGRHVVVGFVIPDDACPPTFTGFDVGPGNPYPTWTPRFVGTGETICNLPLVARFYVLIIDRASLEHGVTFRLPADDTYGFAERLVSIDPAYSIRSTAWMCGPADEMLLTIAIVAPVGSDLTVDVLDRGSVVASGAAPTVGARDEWVVIELEPRFTERPSSNGEIVVTDDDTGRVVIRQPFDHTARPDDFGGCG